MQRLGYNGKTTIHNPSVKTIKMALPNPQRLLNARTAWQLWQNSLCITASTRHKIQDRPRATRRRSTAGR
jgi:hypothetical protein